MWYSDYDICYEVRNAANPYEQIKILAELNDVPRGEVEKILETHGVELPRYQRRSGFYGERKTKSHLSEEERAKKRAQGREWYLRNRERISAMNKKKRREREVASGKK